MSRRDPIPEWAGSRKNPAARSGVEALRCSVRDWELVGLPGERDEERNILLTVKQAKELLTLIAKVSHECE